MKSLRDFPIVGFRTNGNLENAWNVTRGEDVSVSLDRFGRTSVGIHTDQSVYLVLGADGSAFHKVEDGTGIDVSDGGAFVVELAHPPVPGVRAELHLLEYADTGARLSTAAVKAQTRTLYIPAPQVATVLVTVRLRGVGFIALEDIVLDRVERPANVKPGLLALDPEPDSSDGPVGAEKGLHDVTANLHQVVAAGQRAQKALADIRSSVEAKGADADAVRVADGGSLASRRLTRDLLVRLAGTLPESNGSEFFRTKLPYHVAVITDEYMFNFYRDAFAKVTYVRPSEVEDVVREGFDILLYVTCWKGMHDEEWKGVKFRETPAAALDRLLEYASSNSRPTFFQSIEDPSNFEYFLPIAQKFDYVFTSDSDCVESYREALGHDRVAYAEYGANPLVNNPIGSYAHTINQAFFAGSYPERYPERTNDMRLVFDSILRTGQNLVLVDRNFGNDDYAFPEKYAQLSLEPMPHETLQRVHKLFRWSLNFNSIKSSPTMCAMRVYELQAQGRGLISNYARSVFNRFPEIRIVAEDENLGTSFGARVPLEELRNNEAQVRNVMTNCTAQDIAWSLLSKAGVAVPEGDSTPLVALVASNVDEQLRREISRQSYPAVELIEGETPEEVERLVSRCGARYVGTVDVGHQYGEHYVTDRVNAFKYTDSDFVTQSALLEGDEVIGTAHDFVSQPEDGLTLYSVRKVGTEGLVDVCERAQLRGLNGYAIPPFEASGRGDAPARTEVKDPALSIIVPVYNAGRFLLTKCMPSIARNKRSEEFEVILVDDGSTDGETPEICRRLADELPGVRAFCFEDGGSGSASRPRNKGIEMASARRIAFLDPDNEISDEGYDLLLQLMDEAQQEEPTVGFVSGYQVKVSRQSTVTGRHTRSRLSVVRGLRGGYFERGKFPVVSTQAAVIDRRLVDDGSLRFVERAAGQDTLFGWELMLAAENGAFTNDVHLVYYAERDDSVTNSVDTDYFRRKLIMEQAQVAALGGHGLLDVYRESHFRAFLRDWYLPKLATVPEGQRAEARDYLRQIVELYGIDAEL